MYFPRPNPQQPQAPDPSALPGGPAAPAGGDLGGPTPMPHPMVQSVIQGMTNPQNVSGVQNPASGQSNNYAPIPPDEVKRWATLNHVSKGAVKEVEWSQNAGQYVLTMKDGSNERIDPQYILANQGHWAPHPDHLHETLKFMGAQMAKRNLPQIMSTVARLRQGAMSGLRAAAPPTMAPQQQQPPVPSAGPSDNSMQP